MIGFVQKRLPGEKARDYRKNRTLRRRRNPSDASRRQLRS
jgi:hypothetical protein